MSCNCSHCKSYKGDHGDGTGRFNRLIKALDPNTVQIDDRSLEDLLVFMKKYANQIRFYPIQEEDTGLIYTWRTLFEQDMAVVLASVVTADAKQEEKDYLETRENLYNQPTPSLFKSLFGPIIGLARQMDNWLSLTTEDNPLRKDLELLIRSELSLQMLKAFQYAKGFEATGEDPFTLDFQPKNQRIWNLNLSNLIGDYSIYYLDQEQQIELEEEEELQEKLIRASWYVDDIFQAMKNGMDLIVAKSEAHLTFALEQYPQHQPHMALFLAFLELFRFLQNDLNSLTKRHLDFFYKEVLQLKGPAAESDQVFVVFELAKGIAEHVILTNTAVDAGQDEIGQPLIYRTSAETPLVINRAQVTQIKNLFIDRDDDTPQNSQKVSRFFANPVANSADGNGTPFRTPNSSFDTFGVGGRDEAIPLTLCNYTQQRQLINNPATIGFAIASPQLLLSGGKRVIELRATGLDKLVKLALDKDSNFNFNKLFEFWLTGEKGWNQISFKDNVSDAKFEILDTTNKFGIKLTLETAFNKIIPFDSAVHKGDVYPTQNPVLKVILKTLDPSFFSTSITYETDLFIDNTFSLKTNVGNPSGSTPQDGLKDLVLQNSLQRVENDKTFAPFTQLPSVGAPFYIGSKEFFSKIISKYKVNVKFDTPPVTETIAGNTKTRTTITNYANVKLSIWNFPNWIFTGNDINTVISTLLKRYYNLTDEEFASSQANGFFLLSLLKFESKQLIEIIDTTTNNVTNTSSSITVSDLSNIENSTTAGLKFKAEYISLEYESTLNFTDLHPGIDQFFHIYPFGIAETYPTKNVVERLNLENLTNQLFVDTQILDSSSNLKWYLLPQFFYGDRTDVSVLPGDRTQYNQQQLQQGHLFVGVSDLLPLQTLSLLFKFEEGTQADDDDAPGTVHWSYLSNNAWKPLSSERLLSDSTFGLQTSGIILFDIPSDISYNHTLMPPNLVWLCVSVDKEPDRFPRLISIQAQATEVTFDDQGNSASHYEQPLAPGTISQLQEKQSEIKRLQQPFESFGGVPAQQEGIAFYMAASERIRHKGRAITIWDYEHLTLGRFPEIFKVKAIPYTDPACICRDGGTMLQKCPPIMESTAEEAPCCAEPLVAPGHVLIVAIPDFRFRVGGNRLQPKNSNLVLQKIEQYLTKRTNPFTKVHVRNPVYEEVLVSFRVQFYPGVDKGKFQRILNEELVRFLTPWAFEEHQAITDIRFDTRIYASEVINFIEERDYVDFITDFQLFHCKPDCCATTNKDEFIEISGTVGYESRGFQALEGATIQLLGTVIETSTDANGDFQLLMVEGMSLLIKKEEYGTRVLTLIKNKEGKFVLKDLFENIILLTESNNHTFYEIELGEIKKIGGSEQNIDIEITYLNKLNTVTSIPRSIVKLSNTAGDIIPPGNSNPNIIGGIYTNQEITINATGYLPKRIIVSVGKIENNTNKLSVQLMPTTIPSLYIVVKDENKKSAADPNMKNVIISVIGDPSKRASLEVDNSKYKIEDIKTGSFLFITKEGYVPRIIPVLEETIIIDGTNTTVTLNTTLIADKTDCIEDCDDLVEFWEEVRNTYLPGLNGSEIAVSPSTPRSILVSAAKHWIELFEAPPVVDPCALKKESDTIVIQPSPTPSPDPTPEVVSGYYQNPYYYIDSNLYTHLGGTLYFNTNYIPPTLLFYNNLLSLATLNLSFETSINYPNIINPSILTNIQDSVVFRAGTNNVNATGVAQIDRNVLIDTLRNQGFTGIINTFNAGDFITGFHPKLNTTNIFTGPNISTLPLSTPIISSSPVLVAGVAANVGNISRTGF